MNISKEAITKANKILHDLNFEKGKTTTQIVAEGLESYASTSNHITEEEIEKKAYAEYPDDDGYHGMGREGFIIGYNAGLSPTIKESEPKGLDLKELERKLDEALDKETAESLKKWINEKRTANVKPIDQDR